MQCSLSWRVSRSTDCSVRPCGSSLAGWRRKPGSRSPGIVRNSGGEPVAGRRAWPEGRFQSGILPCWPVQRSLSWRVSRSTDCSVPPCGSFLAGWRRKPGSRSPGIDRNSGGEPVAGRREWPEGRFQSGILPCWPVQRSLSWRASRFTDCSVRPCGSSLAGWRRGIAEGSPLRAAGRGWRADSSLEHLFQSEHRG
jgi:hypothetical protein